MGKGKAGGHHWQPPREFNEAPPTARAPHMGTTHRDDNFSSEGNNNIGGTMGRSKGGSEPPRDEKKPY